MAEVKENLFYSEKHEWATTVDGNTVRIGVTDFAQSQLGDIVFLEMPEVGADVIAGDSMGSIESVKTVSELYSPVSGIVTKVNTTLFDQPELVNTEPYDGGWIIEVKVEGSAKEALNRLLTAENYRAITE